MPARPFWRGLFIALLLLECAPFWALQYFPSQDGPSHLYNAAVLANYGTEPLYQEYYRVNLFSPAGNAFTQYLLAILVKLTGPLFAQKLLLSSYIILFFLTFRYFLRSLTPYADYFALFAGTFAPNWFFYMGFWNFCFSICFVLLMVGYHARHQQHSTQGPLRLIALTLSGLVIYLSHAVSWVVCCMAVAALCSLQLLSDLRRRRQASRPLSLASISTAAFSHALPLFTLLPPSIFLLVHVASSKEVSTCEAAPSLGARLWPLYSLSFLPRIGGLEPTLVKVVAVIFVVALLLTVGAVIRRRTFNYWSSSLLFLSFACALLAIIGPDCVGSGSYIHRRMGFYAFLFLAAWAASALRNWSRPVLNVVAALGFGIALVTFTVRFPALSKWSDELSAFVEVGQHIRPNATVLAFSLERQPQDIDPFRHAAGLLSERVIIDLANYEASTDYFSTRFRPDYSPFPALGTLKQLESAPPVFDTIRYEKRTKGRVDYLLIYGHIHADGQAVKSPETESMRRQLAAYTLVRSGDFGRLTLYRRTASEPNRGAGQ